MSSVLSSAEFGVGGPWLAEYTLESVGAGVVVFDAGAQIVQWNATASELLGGVEERFVGRRITDEVFDAVGEDDVPLDPGTCPAARVLRSGDSVTDVVVGVRRTDGSRIWLSVTALPVYGPDGSVRSVMASLRDVTVEMRLQRSVLSSAVQMRLWFENSLVGQAIFGRDGRLIDWNARLLAMAGRTDVELMNEHVGVVCDIDAAWVWNVLDGDDSEPVEGLTWLVRGDGAELPVYGHFWLADRAPHGSVVVAQFLDPSAFQAPAAPQVSPATGVGREAFTHAGIPMLSVTIDGIVVEANLAAGGFLGRHPADLVDEPITALLDGLTPVDFGDGARDAFRTSMRVELDRIVRPHGSSHPGAAVHLSAMGKQSRRPLLLVQLVGAGTGVGATQVVDTLAAD